jgi:cytochrome c oxidase assembly factor CtaG
VRPDPFAWDLHVEALVGLTLLVAAYALLVRRHQASPWRIAAFASGVALLLATAVTPLEHLTFHVLTMHLLQNIVLAEWAPALLVLAVPAGVATRLVHPATALALWLVTYFVWHIPPLYDAALRRPDSLLHLEHVSYLVAGALFWWALLRQPLSAGARTLYLFAAFVLASPIGLLLALLPDPAYDFYSGFEPWELTALEDQRLAGLTMAVEQSIVLFALFVWSFFRFLAEEEAGKTYAWSQSAAKRS